MEPDSTAETVKIRDKDQSTQGGPPGWMAFVIVAMVFLLGAAVVAVVAVLTSG